MVKEPLDSGGVLESLEETIQPMPGRECEPEGTHITDLPAVVLSSVLARINDPVDVVCALCACRLFWTLSQSAPFHLRLRPRQLEKNPGGSCDDSLQSSTQAARAWTRAALSGIRIGMPATQELDLTGCPIFDDDVAATLAGLQCLERLILDSCQKLTSGVAEALAISVQSGPRALSLRRCYGLGPVSAGHLLAAAATDASRLQCIVLSHLDRLDFLQDSASLDRTDATGIEKELVNNTQLAKSIANLSRGAGLRLLALNNCGGLGMAELSSVAVTCPLLEIFLLGGSGQGVGVSRAEELSHEKVVSAASALIGATQVLSRLRVLEITFFTSAVVHAVREQEQRGIQVWDFCEESSVAAAAGMLDCFKELKQGSTVNDLLRHVVTPLQSTSSMTGPNTSTVLFSKTVRSQFRQDGLSLSDCISNGPFSYQISSVIENSSAVLTPPQCEDRWESPLEDVVLALRGPANCSDTRRRTPLHIAASRGDARMIAGLLAIGATVKGAKDSSGATALFVAAESGYAHVCELLLRGGADVLASNRLGETPLYIAALRGHSAAVGIMLAHCHERGVNWQAADVYGDGWTPLMAAAVADRQDVGKVLLSAAGAELGLGPSQKGEPMIIKDNMTAQNFDIATVEQSSETASANSEPVQPKETLENKFCKGKDGKAVPWLRSPPQLLDAQNRYGQTALHIAAQRASVWFVANLLSAGASVDVRNAYGMRAIDLAKRHNHTNVTEMLKVWVSDQRKSCGPNLTPSEQLDRGRRSSGKSCKMRSGKASNLPLDDPPLSQGLGSGGASLRIEDNSLPTEHNPHPVHDTTPSSSCELGVPSVGVANNVILSDEDGKVESIENLIEGLVLDPESNPAHGVTHRGNRNYWRGRGRRGRGTRRRVFPEGPSPSSQPQ